MMKKTISIILLTLLIITFIGCRNVSNQNTPSYTETSQENSLIPIATTKINRILELTDVSFFLSEHDEIYGVNYEKDRQSWYDIIQNVYGIELKVKNFYNNRTMFFYQSGYEERYDYIVENIKDGNISGVMRLYDTSIMKSLIQDRAITPIDMYLTNNSSWASLPDDWKKAFVIENQTYGIPTKYEDRAIVRYIRQDWLDTLHLQKPYTINEFYDVIRHFTYGDPDDDMTPNTSGAIYQGLEGLADIFASFDCRLNYDGKALPTWNPNSNIWEDSLLKPEAIDCLTFLRSCYNENILRSAETLQNDNDFLRGLSGSYSSRYPIYGNAQFKIKSYSSNDISPSIEIIDGLTHIIDKNVTGYYTYYERPYVLTSSTKDPMSTINNLINIFLADREAYLIGRFGPTDSAYFVEDNIVYYKTSLYDDINYTYRFPSIFVDNPMYEFISYPDYMKDSVDEYMLVDYGRFDLLEKSKLSYEIPWEFVLQEELLSQESQIKLLGQKSENIIIRIIEGYISIEDGLKEYNDFAKICGVQEFLDEENLKLGKTTETIY